MTAVAKLLTLLKLLKVRCATEEIRSRSYKSRNFPEKNVKSFSHDDSYNEKENISENENKGRYLILSFDSE